MSLQDKTYSDLLDLIEALAGVDSFTTAEQAKILALVNRRGYLAYLASDSWPRYMVARQARPATDGVIAYTYNDQAGIRNVSSASRSGSTVTVVCTAAVDFCSGMDVTISGLSGSVNPNGTYRVVAVDTTTVTDDTFTYTLDTTNTSTETYSGTGLVTPVAIDDIGRVFRVWGAEPFVLNSVQDCDFFVDSDGIHVSGNFEGLGGFWLSYKKEWEGPYTTVSTDIPQEFFNYIAHTVYADFLRMDGQVDKAMAEEISATAESFLVLELTKIDNQRNSNAVLRRIRTHNSQQARL